jgi:hypothetical protein
MSYLYFTFEEVVGRGRTHGSIVEILWKGKRLRILMFPNILIIFKVTKTAKIKKNLY